MRHSNVHKHTHTYIYIAESVKSDATGEIEAPIFLNILQYDQVFNGLYGYGRAVPSVRVTL